MVPQACPILGIMPRDYLRRGEGYAVFVANDGTADFHPQLATLPNGDALLAWENIHQVLIELGQSGDPCLDLCFPNPNTNGRVTCKKEEMKSKTEIAVARYSAAAGSWGPETTLTANGYLGRTPQIATATGGSAMLACVANETNHDIGSNVEPNDVYYAIYNGTQWTAPLSVAADVPSIVRSALVYDGTHTVFVFVGDTDDHNRTPGDRELFVIAYNGTTWGAVTRLTNDTLDDVKPQIIYDTTGSLLIVWYRGGDLFKADVVTAPTLALANQHAVVELESEASSGVADFRLATGQTGQISLVWQDASEDRVAFYDGHRPPSSSARARVCHP